MFHNVERSQLQDHMELDPLTDISTTLFHEQREVSTALWLYSNP